MKTKVETLEEGLVCLICKKTFTKPCSVRRHMIDIHINSNEKYLCPVCNKIKQNKNNFMSHFTRAHHVRNINYDMCKVHVNPDPLALN